MKLIDIHTHGIGGYDTRTLSESDILKMAEIHGAAGVSEVIPTIYPDTIAVMQGNMMAVRKAIEMQKSETTPTLIGIHLEGPFLNPNRCGALNAETFIEPTVYNVEKLLDGFKDMVKIITIAPEIDGAAKLIRKISDMGITVSMGHSDATYAEAEAGFNAGARGITHIFNAMRGIHHREPGIAGFGLLNKDIYIEVIADPYHLHLKTLELIFRTKKQDRIIIISDSVKGTKPSDGEIKQVVVDDSGRLQGGSMTIIESSGRLIDLGFDEDVIRRCITDNPAAYLY